MTTGRPRYGNAFEYDRVLNVFFYTSNTTKLIQARLLFMRHGYELRHFTSNREPYDEDYALGTELLLSRAVQQVNKEFGVRSIFFVEDTSLRIEALSDKADFPGLAVKEWFRIVTFDQVDEEIRRKENDRRAVVSSDIALYLPALSRPLFFHGETSGEIATSAPNFEESVQYPWLTPTTFNGWFVPAGASKRLGEMEFEESLAFDFRAKSIKALLARLEELNAALNMKPTFYTARRPNFAPGQLSLIPEETRIVVLVIGPKCAGKTTLSDHMAAFESVSVYEASTVLRGIAEDEDASPRNSDEAFAFLEKKGWDIVADKIGRYIEVSHTRWNIVTGLRTPEELLCLKEKFPNCLILMIEADTQIRFERHIRRARDQGLNTFTEFKEEDERQQRFGSLRVANEVADVTIRNEGSIEQYKRKIDETLDEMTKVTSSISTTKERHFGELHRCLWALRNIGRPASCEEISQETARFGALVRIYNTNRALKNVPEFALRIKKPQSLLKYKLTPRGEDLLNLLQLVKGSPQYPQQLPFGW
jgi:inosine/xanthosine triphosphate pyrophosphatase family protein/dephospho-CoA kinase